MNLERSNNPQGVRWSVLLKALFDQPHEIHLQHTMREYCRSRAVSEAATCHARVLAHVFLMVHIIGDYFQVRQDGARV